MPSDGSLLPYLRDLGANRLHHRRQNVTPGGLFFAIIDCDLGDQKCMYGPDLPLRRLHGLYRLRHRAAAGCASAAVAASVAAASVAAAVT